MTNDRSPRDVGLLLRAARGTVDDDEQRELAAWLADDPAAAQLLDLARGLGPSLARLELAGPRDDCPDAMDLALLAEGGLDEEQAAACLAHVGVCPRCLAGLDAALDVLRQDAEPTPSIATGEAAAAETLRAEGRFLVGPAAQSTPFPAASTLRRAGPWLAAAALLLIAWLAWVSGDGADTASHAQLVALAERDELPARRLRDLPDADAPRAALAAALEAYARGDWAAAEEQLQAYLERDPADATAWLYLGSARLLDEQLTAATEAFARAAALDAGAVGTEACWQRAQALLATGDGRAAAAQLADLEQQGGDRATDARRLLSALATLGVTPEP